MLVNVVYALLQESADARDVAEVALILQVDEKSRADLSRHRAELDASLSAPIGRKAVAEQALLRELGG